MTKLEATIWVLLGFIPGLLAGTMLCHSEVQALQQKIAKIESAPPMAVYKDSWTFQPRSGHYHRG